MKGEPGSQGESPLEQGKEIGEEERRVLLEEASSYFRKQPVLRRLLEGFAARYRSLGRFGGTVTLEGLSPPQREILGELLGRDCEGAESVRVTAASLRKALQKTRFASLESEEILEAFIGAPLESKSREQERYREEKEAFFSALQRESRSEGAVQWLEHLKNKGPGSRGVHRAYDRDPGQLRRDLRQVLQALENLPSDYERLPLFASRLTGDPHAFDIHTERGRFLLSALQFTREWSGRELDGEEVNELLAFFGLLREDILNFVTCTGLLAYRKDESSPATTWKHAVEERAVLNAPLREIVRFSSFYPALVHQEGAAAFVVENSGVFSEILDRIASSTPPPLICTHGQFTLTSFLLLDGLALQGVHLYYSGDFDPEGLGMAQRLLQRHPGKVHPWRFSVEDYRYSSPSLPLEEGGRLNMLQHVQHPGLKPLAQAMLNEKAVGCQEKIIDLLVEDLGNYINSSNLP